MRYIFFLVSTFYFYSAACQVGATFGLNFPTQHVKHSPSDSKTEYSTFLSFRAGISSSIELSHGFSLQTNIQLLGKGGNFVFEENGEKYTRSIRIYYVELPDIHFCMID